IQDFSLAGTPTRISTQNPFYRWLKEEKRCELLGFLGHLGGWFKMGNITGSTSQRRASLRRHSQLTAAESLVCGSSFVARRRHAQAGFGQRLDQNGFHGLESRVTG